MRQRSRSNQMWRARQFVIVGAIAMATTSAPTGLGASAARAAPVGSPKVTLIGDSTMAAMSSYSYDNADVDAVSNNDIRDIVGDSYDLTFSAESCRRIVNPSCRGRYGYVPASALPLMRTTLRGGLGEAIVMMAGYDDASIANAVDLVMAEAESQGVTRVIWLTYRTGTNYVLPGGLPARMLYDKHNAELVEAATRHPGLSVLDWDAYSTDRDTWFGADGIHMNRTGAVELATFIKAALDGERAIGRCRASVALTGSTADAPGSVEESAAGSGFLPLPPKRVLDTRDPLLGGSNGKLGAGRTLAIDLAGSFPEDARAVALSVTAVDSCADGFLTVFACGARPTTSSVNFEVGRTTAGMVITSIADGTACVFASAATDVVIDLVGAFTPGGEAFHWMPPTRWVDTRGGPSVSPDVNGRRTTAMETRIAIGGSALVPAAATAVWINLTIADPSTATVLLAYPGPCGTAPLASTVNARAARSAGSAALVGLGPDGSICVRTVTGSSHVVVDVAGYFGPGDGGMFYSARSATRLLDSRTTTSSPLPPGTQQAIPAEDVAVLNVVAVDSGALGYVSVRPCDTNATSSLINTSPAENTANVTAVGPGGSGAVCVRSSVPTHIVVDQVGAFVTD